MQITEINYDKLITKHLKGVMIDALKCVAEQGLQGENHFYITFQTNYPGVQMPIALRTQYPENMTIVLQHQFSDLVVDENQFSVILVFGGVPEPLTVPFDAVNYFADPYAKFGLSFVLEESDESPAKSKKIIPDKPAEVISIDSFRKK